MEARKPSSSARSIAPAQAGSTVWPRPAARLVAVMISESSPDAGREPRDPLVRRLCAVAQPPRDPRFGSHCEDCQPRRRGRRRPEIHLHEATRSVRSPFGIVHMLKGDLDRRDPSMLCEPIAPLLESRLELGKYAATNLAHMPVHQTQRRRVESVQIEVFEANTRMASTRHFQQLYRSSRPQRHRRRARYMLSRLCEETTAWHQMQLDRTLLLIVRTWRWRRRGSSGMRPIARRWWRLSSPTRCSDSSASP